MKSFAAALLLFASAQAGRYRQQYIDPDLEYARGAPLKEDKIKDALAYADPYFPTDFHKESVEKDMIKDYNDAADIVRGMGHADDYIHKKIENLKQKMPHHPVGYVPEEERPVQYIPEARPILQVHEATTGLDEYMRSGECHLTECAYQQAVGWKMAGKRHPTVEREDQYAQHRGENGGNMYYDKFPVIDPNTGMVKMETRLVENNSAPEPSWKKHQEYFEPSDLYNGHTMLPVEITNPAGVTRTGTSVVKDKRGTEKEVTIIDDYSGTEGVTLTLKDSENIVHIQELDEIDTYNQTYGMDGIVDKQLVTVCDEATDVCNLFEIDLEPSSKDEMRLAKPVDTFYAPSDYEKSQEAVTFVEDHIEQPVASEPVLVDPLAVGADEEDICWLEDIIVDYEMGGEPVVETEIFCVDADDGTVYMEPVSEQIESYLAPEILEEPLFAQPIETEPLFPMAIETEPLPFGGPAQEEVEQETQGGKAGPRRRGKKGQKRRRQGRMQQKAAAE